MKLSDTELQRYARHLVLPHIGITGQQKLKNAKILCIGAGGLGSPALLYLAAAGIGTLGIIDDDIVSLENLQRQVLYNNLDIDDKKADKAKTKLKAFNTDIDIKSYCKKLTETNAEELIKIYDVILDCSDNFATRFLINDTCVKLQKPNVSASALQFEGQCSIFCTENGPCYRCLYKTAPPQDLIPNCKVAGIMGVLPGMLGTIQANEAIKLILNIGTPLIGEILTVNTLDLEFRKLKLKKNVNCPICSNHKV